MTHLRPIARAVSLVLAAACLLAAFSACSGVRNRRQALRDAVDGYATAVRWGKVQRAARYLPAKDKAAFIARKRLAYQRLRVHEVEVRSVHLSDDQEKARVLLAMSFTVAGSPVIQHHMIEQIWHHGRGGWIVVSRRRKKRSKTAAVKPGDLY